MEDEQEVIEMAHQLFNVNCDGSEENYEQEDIETKKVKNNA